MKKQFLVVSAAALLSLSSFSNAEVRDITSAVNLDASEDRAVTITGAPANYITDTFTFKLSANVAMAMLQDANAAAATASTFKGTDAVFGGSTQDGVGVYQCVSVGTTLTATTDMTAVSSLATPCTASS